MDRAAIGEALAFGNALMNGASAILVFAGWRMIRAKRPLLHRRLMLTALAVSTVFLVSYLTRVAITGTHRYPGHGLWKGVYYAILFSHMTLAALTPPLVLRSVYLALKRRFDEHKRLVAVTLPVWLYVSVTGVLVYVLLYHPPAAS